MSDEQAGIVWRPQKGPQKALIDCPLTEILFGGARGGGKTDGILGKYALKAEAFGRAFNGVFFRREMPQQDDLIERGKEIYLPLGAQWQEQKKTFIFPTGGRLRFRPLENLWDAEKYQGQNLSDAAVEEAGNYPDSAPIDRLFGALRSAAGVPAQLLLTANPGGAGHQWIKARYIDPWPAGNRILRRQLPSGKEHRYTFIPSRVMDNSALLHRDPGYVDRLHLVGSEALVRAWLEGDWNAITGAYFDCWKPHHIVRPFEVPRYWTRFGAFDWGSARPFCYQLWAVSDGSALPDGRRYPTGAIICIQEWYGASSPNVGLKLPAEAVADGIKLREAGHEVATRVADPACWKVDGGPSIFERMALRGVLFRQADNSRLTGWDQLRSRMIGEDNTPMIYWFNTCVDSIRTIPALQHDDMKPEDLDTDGEDHAADTVRYAAMSRPYTRHAAVQMPMRTIADMTMDELWKHHENPGRAYITHD